MSNINKKANNSVVKKSWTDSKLWWVFGWLFIFPVPLTTILMRSKKINKKLAVALSIISWAIYIIAWIFEELV